MNTEPGAVFDAHVRAEFVECSVDATMATMTEAPYVTHVPVLTGGHGRDEVQAFYRLVRRPLAGRHAGDAAFPYRRAGPRDRLAHRQLYPRRGDAGAAAGYRADRPQGDPAARRADGHRGRQGCVRAHLLGPGLAPCAGGSPRSGRAAGGRRRAGCQASRSFAAVERIDPSRPAAKGLICDSLRMNFDPLRTDASTGATSDGR